MRPFEQLDADFENAKDDFVVTEEELTFLYLSGRAQKNGDRFYMGSKEILVFPEEPSNGQYLN